MKKWLNYLPTLFIIIILASLLMFSTQGSVSRLNYTQFQKIAEEADFKDSSLNISSTIIKAEGTYQVNGRTQSYSVIIRFHDSPRHFPPFAQNMVSKSPLWYW